MAVQYYTEQEEQELWNEFLLTTYGTMERFNICLVDRDGLAITNEDQ